MSTAKQHLVDLLATGRVANLPSVLSNTFLGAVLAWELSDAFDQSTYLSYAPVILGPLLAAACFYLGGCFLNDWHDAEWDRQHRPERAIPSGRSSPLGIGLVAFALLGAGLGLSFLQGLWTGIVGLSLLGAIAVYTVIHKRSAWGVVFMGLSRALLYPLGFLAQPDPVVRPDVSSFFHFRLRLLETETKIVVLVILGIGLLSYIAGLSLFARHESKGTLRGNLRLLAFCLVGVPILTHSCLTMSQSPLMTLAGLAPFGVLLLLPLLRSVTTSPRRIGLLLASIPLVDFICMPALAQTIVMNASIAPLDPVPLLPSMQILCAVPLVAYVLGRLLQRIAPAS